MKRAEEVLAYPTLDPVIELACQRLCDVELHETLLELLGFVRVAEMPPETRARLTDGIAHLRKHIEAQSKLAWLEMLGRAC